MKKIGILLTVFSLSATLIAPLPVFAQATGGFVSIGSTGSGSFNLPTSPTGGFSISSGSSAVSGQTGGFQPATNISSGGFNTLNSTGYFGPVSINSSGNFTPISTGPTGSFMPFQPGATGNFSSVNYGSTGGFTTIPTGSFNTATGVFTPAPNRSTGSFQSLGATGSFGPVSIGPTGSFTPITTLPGTGSFVPTCQSGYFYNTATNSCRANTPTGSFVPVPTSSNPIAGTGSFIPTCQSGYVYNVTTNSCRAISTGPTGSFMPVPTSTPTGPTGSFIPTCPSGYVYNTTTHSCKATGPTGSFVPTCPAGYTYNTATLTCKAPTTPIQCPSGYTLQNGICVPPISSCPTGYTLSGNVCVPISYGISYYTSCGSGYYYNTNTNSCYPDINYTGCAVNCGYPYYQNYNYSYGYPAYSNYSYYSATPVYTASANYYPIQPAETEVTIPQTTTRTVYIPRPTATNNVVVASADTLDTYNITVRTDLENNTIVSWENNVPTVGEVVFGLASQPVDGLANYSYDFTTGILPGQLSRHEVNIGRLELNRSYYMRIISRTQKATDITSEFVYIPVPGKHQNPVEQPTLANVSSAFGNTGVRIIILVLLLVIIGTLVYIINRRRNSR